MNEKYGIELQLLTSAFNKQVEQVKKSAESIKKAFDPSDVSGMKINGLSQIKGISNEFKKLTGKKYGLADAFEIQRLRTGLNDVGTKAKEVKKEVSDVGYIKYDPNSIQKVIDGYGQVEKKVKQATKEVKMLNKEAKNTSTINTGFNHITKGIDQVTSKIKRFALSLFSIRSIYALVSKASSAYLYQDTQLANKLQAVWIRFRFIARTNYI